MPLSSCSTKDQEGKPIIDGYIMAVMGFFFSKSPGTEIINVKKIQVKKRS